MVLMMESWTMAMTPLHWSILTLILKVLLHWLVNCTRAKSTSKIFNGVNGKDDQVPMLLNHCQEEDVEEDEEEHIVFIGGHWLTQPDLTVFLNECQNLERWYLNLPNKQWTCHVLFWVFGANPLRIVKKIKKKSIFDFKVKMHVDYNVYRSKGTRKILLSRFFSAKEVLTLLSGKSFWQKTLNTCFLAEFGGSPPSPLAPLMVYHSAKKSLVGLGDTSPPTPLNRKIPLSSILLVPKVTVKKNGMCHSFRGPKIASESINAKALNILDFLCSCHPRPGTGLLLSPWKYWVIQENNWILKMLDFYQWPS